MIELDKKIGKEVKKAFSNVPIKYQPKIIITFDPANSTWDTQFYNIPKRSVAMTMLSKAHVALKRTLVKGFRPIWEETLIKENNNESVRNKKRANG